METKAQNLSAQLADLNNRLIHFVENCSEADWGRPSAEEWPVGVVARHIAAGHYDALDFVQKMVAAEPLPELTMEAIVASANEHARKHADCTRSEVMELLRRNGAHMQQHVAGLSDSQLAATGRIDAMGGEVSVQQFLDMVILQSAGEHFQNMQNAVSD